jgi:hypothetical protein
MRLDHLKLSDQNPGATGATVSVIIAKLAQRDDELSGMDRVASVGCGKNPQTLISRLRFHRTKRLYAFKELMAFPFWIAKMLRPDGRSTVSFSWPVRQYKRVAARSPGVCGEVIGARPRLSVAP